MLTLFVFLLVIILIVSLWKVFEKAGEAGWKSLIPFYNMWVLAEISGLPGWVGLLAYIPYLGAIVIFYIYYSLSKRFNKGVLFSLGLFLLPFIFFPILGFGADQYVAPTIEEDKKPEANLPQ